MRMGEGVGEGEGVCECFVFEGMTVIAFLNPLSCKFFLGFYLDYLFL